MFWTGLICTDKLLALTIVVKPTILVPTQTLKTVYVCPSPNGTYKYGVVNPTSGTHYLLTSVNFSPSGAICFAGPTNNYEFTIDLQSVTSGIAGSSLKLYLGISDPNACSTREAVLNFITRDPIPEIATPITLFTCSGVNANANYTFRLPPDYAATNHTYAVYNVASGGLPLFTLQGNAAQSIPYPGIATTYYIDYVEANLGCAEVRQIALQFVIPNTTITASPSSGSNYNCSLTSSLEGTFIGGGITPESVDLANNYELKWLISHGTENYWFAANTNLQNSNTFTGVGNYSIQLQIENKVTGCIYLSNITNVIINSIVQETGACFEQISTSSGSALGCTGTYYPLPKVSNNGSTIQDWKFDNPGGVNPHSNGGAEIKIIHGEFVIIATTPNTSNNTTRWDLIGTTQFPCYKVKISFKVTDCPDRPTKTVDLNKMGGSGIATDYMKVDIVDNYKTVISGCQSPFQVLKTGGPIVLVKSINDYFLSSDLTLADNANSHITFNGTFTWPFHHDGNFVIDEGVKIFMKNEVINPNNPKTTLGCNIFVKGDTKLTINKSVEIAGFGSGFWGGIFLNGLPCYRSPSHLKVDLSSGNQGTSGSIRISGSIDGVGHAPRTANYTSYTQQGNLYDPCIRGFIKAKNVVFSNCARGFSTGAAPGAAPGSLDKTLTATIDNCTFNNGLAGADGSVSFVEVPEYCYAELTNNTVDYNPQLTQFNALPGSVAIAAMPNSNVTTSNNYISSFDVGMNLNLCTANIGDGTALETITSFGDNSAIIAQQSVVNITNATIGTNGTIGIGGATNATGPAIKGSGPTELNIQNSAIDGYRGISLTDECTLSSTANTYTYSEYGIAINNDNYSDFTLNALSCNVFDPSPYNNFTSPSSAVYIGQDVSFPNSIGGDGRSGNLQPSGNVWPVGNRAAGPISGWSSPSNWYSVYNEGSNPVGFYTYDNEFYKNISSGVNQQTITTLSATTDPAQAGPGRNVICTDLPSYVFPLRTAAPADTGNGITAVNNSLNNNLLGECVPNPAQSETNISYKVPENTQKAFVTVIEIASGRVMQNLELDKTANNLSINTRNLAPGFYALKLNLDGNNVAVRKLVVLK